MVPLFVDVVVETKFGALLVGPSFSEFPSVGSLSLGDPPEALIDVFLKCAILASLFATFSEEETGDNDAKEVVDADGDKATPINAVPGWVGC